MTVQYLVTHEQYAKLFPIDEEIKAALTPQALGIAGMRFYNVYSDIAEEWREDNAVSHDGRALWRYLFGGESIDDLYNFLAHSRILLGWATPSVPAVPNIGSLADIPDRMPLLAGGALLNYATTFRAALSLYQTNPHINVLEVGTGTGVGIAFLASHMPEATFKTFTLSKNQAHMASELLKRFGITNVEVICRDVFDPDYLHELIGWADFVGAIEVTGHFTGPDRQNCFNLLAGMLKPGGVLALMDTPGKEGKRIPGVMKWMLNRNLGWVIPEHDDYLATLLKTGLNLKAWVNYDTTLSFEATYGQMLSPEGQKFLRERVGPFWAKVWPWIVLRLYGGAARKTYYALAILE